ncbi:MAG: lipoate--protein ligase family protein [Candidatus Lokiarchaeota archaeon]|nr:lipoate--protein ligase family protein [Candidatus Lokiarchaeota archaeon]
MAIDEAVMHSVREGDVQPTLRFYRWKPSAVSIGTFQGMRDEVDLEYCNNHGIDYIRRVTGGGAVYHDYQGEITYSLIVPIEHRLAPDDILESYQMICQGLINGLAHLGIESEFKPINDITSHGKKISGNAQTRQKRCLLQHGTILRKLDVRKMFSVLKVPEEKISDKMIADVKDRVISIEEILGGEINFGRLEEALRNGFKSALDIEFDDLRLTQREMNMAEELVESKYSTNEWNLSR